MAKVESLRLHPSASNDPEGNPERRIVNKIAISAEANQHLDQIVQKYNEEKRYGKIEKQVVASYAILK